MLAAASYGSPPPGFGPMPFQAAASPGTFSELPSSDARDTSYYRDSWGKVYAVSPNQTTPSSPWATPVYEMSPSPMLHKSVTVPPRVAELDAAEARP